MPNIPRRIGLLVGFLGIPKSFRGLRGLAVNAQYPQKIELLVGFLGIPPARLKRMNIRDL
jgi:hypothetical protein